MAESRQGSLAATSSDQPLALDSVVITGTDSMKLLDQALAAVRTFHPLSQQEVASLLATTAEAAATGQYEQLKTGNAFDATARNVAWLG